MSYVLIGPDPTNHPQDLIIYIFCSYTGLSVGNCNRLRIRKSSKRARSTTLARHVANLTCIWTLEIIQHHSLSDLKHPERLDQAKRVFLSKLYLLSQCNAVSPHLTAYPKLLAALRLRVAQFRLLHCDYRSFSGTFLRIGALPSWRRPFLAQLSSCCLNEYPWNLVRLRFTSREAWQADCWSL